MEEKRASFFIRVWTEPREKDGEKLQWRASVQLVGEEGKRYFEDPGALLDFLRDRIEGFDSPQNNTRRYLE